MRPSILFPLFAETRTLPGVGPRLQKAIARVAGGRLVDLVLDLPTGLIDRSYRPRLIDAEEGRIATVEVNVLDHLPPRDRKQPYKVRVSDDSAAIELVFFHAHADYLNKMLPVGQRRVISGKIERFGQRLQMAHPDHIVPLGEEDTLLQEPVYGLTEGLPAKPFAKAIRAALEKVPEMPEWQDEAFHRAHHWDSFLTALDAAHAPRGEADLSPTAPARMRLAYDELLANQLALVLIRARMRGQKGRGIKGDGHLKAKAIAALPFTLTAPQLQSLAEIEADMAGPVRMLRLLQGDVGSGKTVVAMLALLGAVEAGCQGALMAPTEILARQHMAALEPLAKAAGVRMALLTGRVGGAPRGETLAALAEGKIDILVGTHALFSEDVTFRDLALAVVDEQHKFGVHPAHDVAGQRQPAR